MAVPQVADEELDAIKLKISHLRSEIQREKVSRNREQAGGLRGRGALVWVPGRGFWVLKSNSVSSSEPTRAARPQSV